MRKLVGRGQGDAVKCALAGAVGEIVDGVITRHRDDSSNARCHSVAQSKLSYEQPRGTSIDGEVAIKTLNGRVKNPRVDRLRVAHDEHRYGSELRFNLVKQRGDRLRLFEIGFNHRTAGARFGEPRRDRHC